MSVRIVGDTDEPKACLYDSVTGTAFGPVFDSVQEADNFLEWTATSRKIEDLRSLHDSDLESLRSWWQQETQ